MAKKTVILAILIFSLCGRIILSEPDIDKYLSPILSPIKIIASFIFAISLVIGILGFIILIAKGAINWITGGSYGRTSALRTFENAAEVLAIIPIIFLIIEVLKTFNVSQVTEIANILESLLNESFRIIIKLLQSEV